MSYSAPIPFRIFLLALAIFLTPVSDAMFGGSMIVYADDDDGGDDDDDDDDDDDGGAPIPTLDAAPDEVIATGLSDADLTQLLDEGFELLQQIDTGPTLVRLRIPQGLSLEAARTRVRTLLTGTSADFNHYYRTSTSACEGPSCPALQLVGYPSNGICASSGIRIGIVDTGINSGHEVFNDRDLTVHRVSDDMQDPSRAIHGTSVAAILIGAPDSRSPGLLPEATLLAVDAFYRDGADERADAFSIAAGLDWLRAREVEVVNLSLSGSDNVVLEDAINRIAADDVLVIAAAGNDGPRSAPAYPAAYENTIAVTAVDARAAVYRRAAQGPHIDLAAPGVDIWTAASVSGARWRTGTSFAAPFATAAAAQLRHNRPDSSAAETRDHLFATARDIGDPGRDVVFGAGLLQMQSDCAPVPQ